MSSYFFERSFADLPTRYMSSFSESVDKCVAEWGYIHGNEKPRFITMVMAGVLEEMFLLVNENDCVYEPRFIKEFSELIDSYGLFEISPFSDSVNKMALVVMQSVWMMDARVFTLNTDFWETLLMDVISSVIHVSTTNRLSR